MSPRRLNATPNIKAKTGVSIGAAVLARSAGRKENAQRPTFNAQRRSQNRVTNLATAERDRHRDDMIDGLRVDRIDIGKIGIVRR